MTGEISLCGRNLIIGGLKEKAIAVYKSGVKVILVFYNKKISYL